MPRTGRLIDVYVCDFIAKGVASITGDLNVGTPDIDKLTAWMCRRVFFVSTVRNRIICGNVTDLQIQQRPPISSPGLSIAVT